MADFRIYFDLDGKLLEEVDLKCRKIFQVFCGEKIGQREGCDEIEKLGGG